MAVIEVSQDVLAWRELLARHADLSCALERELQAGHQLGMSEFEVLERLTELPEQFPRFSRSPARSTSARAPCRG